MAPPRTYGVGQSDSRAALALGFLAAAAVSCSVTVSPERGAHSEHAGHARGVAPSAQVVQPEQQSGLYVKLAAGPLLGQQVGDTREFLGIPYGRPPVGKLRFAAPLPAEAWGVTRDATHFGPACPQADISIASQDPTSEDCLSLNVYTPANVTQPLPVMVFIHGGAFVAGSSGMIDAKALSEQAPVVVVTLNYRLGALGFLSHPALDEARADAPSGSDGLRDQQLALRWVRDNIRAFGGDADNVTLFGESAGAISTCVHWLAPGSRDLARRFIMQSGTCTSDGFGVQTKKDADALGRRFAEALCPGATNPLSCLRDKPIDELMHWGAQLGQFGAGWQPAVEGRGGVLPDTVERLIATADSLGPILIGTNAHEWGLFQRVGARKVTHLEKLASILADTFVGKAAQVSREYPARTDNEANDVYVELVTDVSFRCPTRNVAELASQRGASVFVYSFEQGTAYHAQELDYVFADNTMAYYGGGPPSAALTALVQRYWTRFASSGDPNGGDDLHWPRYQTASDRHLVLVDPPRVGSGLSRAHCDFWRDYFLKGGTIDLR